MDFGFVLLYVLSLILLAMFVVLAIRSYRIPGALSFGLLALMGFLWVLATFFELEVVSFEDKLFWRNLAQLPAFSVSVVALLFVLVHLGTPRHVWGPVAGILGLVQLNSIILIWTNDFHHLMRTGAALETTLSGQSVLVIRQTSAGMVAVSFDYTVLLVAVMLLVYEAIRRPPSRVQLLVLAAGFSIPIGFSILTSILGPTWAGAFSVSLSLALGSLVVLVGLRSFGLILLTPKARELALEVIDEGILVSAPTGEVVDVNPAAQRMLARTFPLTEKSVPRTYGDFLFGKISAHPKDLIAQDEFRFQLESLDGGPAIFYRLKSYPLRADGRLLGFTSVLQDVTEATLRLHDLRDKSIRDPLTGILNRQAFQDQVSLLLGRSSGSRGYLMVLDIDHFKDFNDSYGHLVGDAVLRAVCRRCQEILREDDTFGRIGGDEFGLVLVSLSGSAVASLADRLRRAIAEVPVRTGENEVSVSISAGVAPLEGKDYESVFKRADVALYQSKLQGRNRVTVVP